MKTLSIKAKIASKVPQEDGQVNVYVHANYTDDDGNRVNEEWAKYTPAFSMTMVVKDDDVVDGFEVGDAIEILIQKEV